MWHAIRERKKECEESGIDGKKENEWEEPIKLRRRKETERYAPILLKVS